MKGKAAADSEYTYTDQSRGYGDSTAGQGKSAVKDSTSGEGREAGGAAKGKAPADARETSSATQACANRIWAARVSRCRGQGYAKANEHSTTFSAPCSLNLAAQG